jgi:hypothetical protein
MAKPIYIGEDDIEEMLKELKAQLYSTKCFGGIDIKKSFKADGRDVTIYFTQDAWAKVNALVGEFDTEVQWHGCVNRISDNEFEIYDILVPPHTVTGATVTSDPEKYSKWINDLDDDTFEHLKFHGHSHVNMGCTPSGTDMTYRHDVVTQLPIPRNENEDQFYIFLIFNKKGAWTGEVYDLKNNALYETKDISIEVYADGDGLISIFVANAKKMAVKEVAVAKPTTYDYYKSKGAKKEDKKSEAKQYDTPSYPYSSYDDYYGRYYE